MIAISQLFEDVKKKKDKKKKKKLDSKLEKVANTADVIATVAPLVIN